MLAGKPLFKDMKEYKITRTVIEEYFVQANNKKEAAEKIEDPHTITVKSEKIKLYKSNNKLRCKECGIEIPSNYITPYCYGCL